MKDYRQKRTGKLIAQLTTEELHYQIELSNLGYTSYKGEGGLAADCVRERLLLEVYIRENKLRDPYL